METHALTLDKKSMNWVWHLGKKLLVGVVIGTAISDELFGVAQLQGDSMQPTLMDAASFFQRDLLLLNRLPAHDFSFSRGDVVVFRSPLQPKLLMVKRLIALEGDVVKLPGSPGKTVEVPKGRCWVEGDNTPISFDSRNMGPIPIALLHAKVTRVIWPPERFGKVISVPHNERLVMKQDKS